MFFTRLAVAAFSFGSIAQVFAAPIGTGLEPIGVSTPAVDGSVVRRDDLTFMGTMAQAIGMLEPVKAQIATLGANPSGAVTPELVAAMGKVAPIINTVSTKLDSLKAAGVDKDAILLKADGVGKTTSEAVISDVTTLSQMVDDICSSIEGLKSLSLVKTELANIKSEVAYLTNVIQAVFSVVPALVEAVNGLVHLFVVLVAHIGNLEVVA